MRKPGLSKANERKLAQASKLLSDVGKNLDKLEGRERDSRWSLLIAVSKAAGFVADARKELATLAATRSFGVNFYGGNPEELLASYGTSGETLTLDSVIRGAEEYRRNPRGSFGEAAPDLSTAKLEVYEIVPGAKKRLVLRRNPGEIEITRTMEKV